MESDIRCGLGKCHPGWLQRFRSIACFTAVFGASTCFTSSLVFYVSSQITALEKQFGFSSFQSGVLLSCNEVGFLITCLIVSFFARKVHIPRVLALSTFFTGVCGIFASIAYYITPKDHLYDVKPSMAVNLSTESATSMQMGQLCNVEMTNRTKASHTQLEHCQENQSQEGGISTEATNAAFAIITIGMFIGGIAKSPRDPFSTTYIDDNVHKTKTAMYIGVLGSVGIFGPALGYGMGGIFSKVYVTLEDVYINPEDRRWIGAWWLGFVVFGCLSVLSAIPTLFFPRRFYPRIDRKEKQRNGHKMRILSTIKEFCRSVLRLLKNPIYMLLVLSTCIDIFNVSGWMAFEPKYMETQYDIPAWRANLYIGIVSVVPAGLGCLIGGIITSKFKLSPLSCVKFLVGGVIACILLPLISLFLGCSNPEIIGLQNGMTTPGQTLNSLPNASNILCGDRCNCDEYSFSPVCGEDGVTYFSPCLAGCKEFDKEIYSMCACLMNQKSNGTATSGLCKSECTMMWPYLILNLVFGIFITVYLIPVTMLFMRCVSEEDKTMALGMLAFLTTLTGWFPGPVVFGKIVDSCCIIWTTGCENQGACSQYDIEKFRFRKNILSVILYAAMIFLAFVIHALAKRKTDWSTADSFKSTDDEDRPETDKLMKGKEARDFDTGV